MRGTSVRSRLATALALLVLGSRPARGEDSLAYPFESKARAPEGDALALTFSPKEGDVFEEKVVQSGKSTAPGKGGTVDKKIAATATIVHRCEKVRPDGTRVMTSRVESLGGDDARDPEEADEMKKVVVTWEADRLGAVKRRSAEGGSEEARVKVERRLFDPGARTFLVFPAAGVRVGEALDYWKMFDAEEVRRTLMSPELSFTPDVKSEAVCVRKTTVADEAAVEFALNAVLHAAADLPDGRGRMESASRCTGSIVVSTKTGVPVGRMEQRIEGRVGATAGDATITVTRDVKVVREFKRRATR